MYRSWLKLASLAALVACGDSTGVTVNDLEGTWTATEMVFTSQADPSTSIDLVAAGGSLTLTIRADGTFTTAMREPGGEIDIDTGTVSVEGTVLTIAESGQGSPTAFSASRSGDNLTLTSSDEDYDFDGDDIEDEATLRILLQR
jgi:hypothetical protein